MSEQVSEQVSKEIDYAIECLRGFDEALKEADEKEGPFVKGKYKSLQVGIHNEDYEMFTKMVNLLKRLKKEIERKNKLIEKNRIALEDCLKYKSEEDYE